MELRAFTPEDRPAGHAMRVAAFSAAARAEFPEGGEIYIPDDRRLGAFVDGELLGQAGAWRLGQWFLGRRVPMAGVAAVIVAPHARRSRLAGRLMGELLVRCVEQGDLMATLDPTAPGLYRGLGFDYAGVYVTRTVPTKALLDLPRAADPPTLRPFRWEDDVDAAWALWCRWASKAHGRLDRSRNYMRRHLEPDDEIRQWVAERDDEIVGFVDVEKLPPLAGDASVFRQNVTGLAAADRDTWLTLWRMVGSEASVCASTILHSAPHEPLLDELSLVGHEQTVRFQTWMSRLLDVTGAVAARGWPAGARATVPLQISDPVLAGNDGAFVLDVADGEAHLTPGGQGRVTVDIGTLTALFTGHVQASSAAFHGQLRGVTAADIAALEEVFRSPQPYLVDHF